MTMTFDETMEWGKKHGAHLHMKHHFDGSNTTTYSIEVEGKRVEATLSDPQPTAEETLSALIRTWVSKHGG
jgi:hypothetical protein